MNRPAIVWLTCCLALSAGRAMAQTDVSLRIRSLGTSLGGIVDDYLTDAFLNPARTSRLNGPMLYGGRLPSRTIEVRAPVVSSYRLDDVPTENSFTSFRVEPIVMSYFRALPGRGVVAIALETYVSSDDRFDSRSDLRLSSFGRIEDSFDVSGSETDTQHYVFDLSAATGQSGLGLRVRGLYQVSESQSASASDQTSTSMDLVDVSTTFRSNLFSRRFEKTELRAEIGFAGAGLVRDVVVGGSLGRELIRAVSREIDSTNNDADGNGVPLGGGSRRRVVTDDSYNSNRDYGSYGVSARVHLQYSDRVRGTWLAEWARSNGDGDADFRLDSDRTGSFEEQRNSGARYYYDGDADDFRVESSIGTSLKITEDVLIAGAARGSYSLVDFDEDGTGSASLTIGGRDAIVDTSFASRYAQRHDNQLEVYELVIPVAVEWRFHRYGKLRIGVDFRATHTDDQRVLEREIGALRGLSAVPQGNARQIGRIALQSRAGAVFNSGLEININDRFILDLLAYVPASTIDLARYGFLSARYRF